MKLIIKNYLDFGLKKDELEHYKCYTKTVQVVLDLQSMNCTQWSDADYIQYFNTNIEAIGTDHFIENIELAINEGNGYINNIINTILNYKNNWPKKNFLFDLVSFKHFGIGMATHLAAGFDLLNFGKNRFYIHYDDRVVTGAKALFDKEFETIPNPIPSKDVAVYLEFNRICRKIINQKRFRLYNLDLTRFHNICWHYNIDYFLYQ